MESFSSSSVTRNHCFAEEDDGLASIAGMESGFSWNHPNTRPFCHSKRNSLRNLSHHCSYDSVPSPRSVIGGFSVRFHDSRLGFSNIQQPHFLDSCFLCKKPLGGYKDIFMYRGDAPFCSEECREEQIERDEAKEKKHSVSSSMKALRRKEQRISSSSSSPSKSQDYSFATSSTVAAACK